MVAEPQVVAAIDQVTRAVKGERTITWVNVPSARAGQEGAVVTVDPLGEFLLRWISEKTVSGSGPVRLTEFDSDDSDGAVLNLAEELASQGMLVLSIASDGSTQALLTEGGAVAVAEAAACFADPVQRAEALRCAMLRWLFDQQNQLQQNQQEFPPHWKYFLATPGALFRGQFVSAGDVGDAAAHLAEMGLLRGNGWDMPWLTAEGWNCVAYQGGDVKEYLKQNSSASGRGTTVNIGGQGNTWRSAAAT